MTPLICDLPYPSVNILTKDLRSGHILSFAYATQRGEISAALQYIYHSFYMKEINAEYADILLRISVAEMKHVEILGSSMIKLGAKPLFTQYPNSKTYYDSSAISQATTLRKMIMDDIQGEMDAIAGYQKMLFVLKNEQVSEIIRRIILDEELHIKTLKEMLITCEAQQ